MKTESKRRTVILIGIGLLGGLFFCYGGYYYASAEYDTQLSRKMLVLLDAYFAIKPDPEKIQNTEKAKLDCANYLGVLVADYRDLQRSVVRRQLLRGSGSEENEIARRWDEIVSVAAKFGPDDPGKKLPVP